MRSPRENATELAEMRDRLDKNMIYVTHDQIEAMTLATASW